MTDKELSKLRRTELLEMLISQGKENVRLQGELEQARAELAARKLDLEEAGTMADAAFKINDVIGAAQRAVDLYTENVKRFCTEQETKAKQAVVDADAYAQQTVTDADERAQWLLTAARDQAAHILQEAHAEAKKLTSDASESAAQIRLDAHKEKEAVLEQARKDAEIIRSVARKEMGEEEPQPEPEAKEKRTFWKKDK